MLARLAEDSLLRDFFYSHNCPYTGSQRSMFSERKFEEQIWKVRWPVIAIAVVLLVATIQILRVNRPVEEVKEEIPAPKYTDKGPLLTGNVWIDPHGFHAVRIDLNRKARIAGKFNTPSLKQRVTLLLLDEQNFEAWKTNADFRPLVSTGAIPVGRISPTLGPGTFFLVIDNRANENRQAVETDFSVE